MVVNVSLIWRLICWLTLAMLTACASAPEQAVPSGSGPAFYPPLPEPPRIQHLVKLTGSRSFAPQGSRFATFIAGEDKGEDMISIYGLAMFDGRLHVVDSRRASIAIFDFVKQEFSQFFGSSGQRMKSPVNISIDSDGTKYIADTGSDQILIFDRENRHLGAFGELGQFRPGDIAIAGDKLYVVDVIHHNVAILDKRSGKVLSTFGKKGSGDGELLQPTNIAIASNGDVLVVDTANFRVQRFSAEGKWLGSFGEAGDRAGKFARPKGIALDKHDRIYISDAAFQNVQIFSPEGRVMMDFGRSSKNEGLSLPAGVAIDYDHVSLFKRYADPKFEIEYLIFVASQMAPTKVDVYGYGRMQGVEYPADEKPAAKAQP